MTLQAHPSARPLSPSPGHRQEESHIRPPPRALSSGRRRKTDWFHGQRGVGARGVGEKREGLRSRQSAGSGISNTSEDRGAWGEMSQIFAQSECPSGQSLKTPWLQSRSFRGSREPSGCSHPRSLMPSGHKSSCSTTVRPLPETGALTLTPGNLLSLSTALEWGLGYV